MTPKQKRFADGYIDTGNATEAATKAYKPKKRATARSIGSENLTKPDILAYIDGKAGAAISTIYKLSMKANSEAIRLRASQDILDRAGYKATDKLAIQKSDGETFLEAVEMAAKIRSKRAEESRLSRALTN